MHTSMYYSSHQTASKGENFLWMDRWTDRHTYSTCAYGYRDQAL